MTQPSLFDKHPSEVRNITIDFSNRLPTAVTVASGTCAALDMETLSDVTGTVLTSPTCTVTTTTATIKVQAGSANRKYKLTFSVTLSSTEVFIEVVYMQVREP